MTAQVWLSFADETGSLGVAVVDVEPIDVLHGGLAAAARRAQLGVDVEVDEADATMVAAITKAHELGVNPGGDVRGVLVPDDLAAQHRELGIVGRLLQRADLEELGLL